MEPDPSSLPADLRERSTRERLGRMVVALLDHWELGPADQATPHDLELAYRWIGTPNRRFADASPLDIMKKHGYEGILAVRRYLDFERGR